MPARVLGTLVQEYVQPAGWTLVATDIELQGADGGYLIWDGFPQGLVVSMAALDPRYWREPVDSEAQRTRAIKIRARSACISVIGSLLGLQRCTNRSCYLCVDVDTLPEIDEMRIIGDEHACPELGNRVFRPDDDSACGRVDRAGSRSFGMNPGRPRAIRSRPPARARRGRVLGTSSIGTPARRRSSTLPVWPTRGPVRAALRIAVPLNDARAGR